MRNRAACCLAAIIRLNPQGIFGSSDASVEMDIRIQEARYRKMHGLFTPYQYLSCASG